jgi:hypothetical protein
MILVKLYPSNGTISNRNTIIAFIFAYSEYFVCCRSTSAVYLWDSGINW